MFSICAEPVFVIPLDIIPTFEWVLLMLFAMLVIGGAIMESMLLDVMPPMCGDIPEDIELEPIPGIGDVMGLIMFDCIFEPIPPIFGAIAGAIELDIMPMCIELERAMPPIIFPVCGVMVEVMLFEAVSSDCMESSAHAARGRAQARTMSGTWRSGLVVFIGFAVVYLVVGLTDKADFSGSQPPVACNGSSSPLRVTQTAKASRPVTPCGSASIMNFP